MSIRRTAWGLVLTWLGSALLPVAAFARDANTKENSTRAAAVGLTAASAVLLTKKNTRNAGIAVGAGAAYAWKKHHDYVVQRHKDTSRAGRYVYLKDGRRVWKSYPSGHYVYYKNGRKVWKPGPNGKAVGYYTRSAHSSKKVLQKSAKKR